MLNLNRIAEKPIIAIPPIIIKETKLDNRQSFNCITNDRGLLVLELS